MNDLNRRIELEALITEREEICRAMDAGSLLSLSNLTRIADKMCALKDPAPAYTPEDGERCQRCGTQYLLVYRAPDNIWDKVGGGKNLLCISCLDTLARLAGVSLYWEAFPGGFKDSRYTPEDVARLVEAARLTVQHFSRKNLYPEVNFMGDDEHEAWGALDEALAPFKEKK